MFNPASYFYLLSFSKTLISRFSYILCRIRYAKVCAALILKLIYRGFNCEPIFTLLTLKWASSAVECQCEKAPLHINACARQFRLVGTCPSILVLNMLKYCTFFLSFYQSEWRWTVEKVVAIIIKTRELNLDARLENAILWIFPLPSSP